MNPFFVLAQYPNLLDQPAVSLGNHGGFSGAQLWRITGDRGDWCLRAWPEGGMDCERLTKIHRLMDQARTAGLAFVPRVHQTIRGHSCVEYGGRLWEVVSWMPGKADFWQQPSAARIEAACTALAQVHWAWRPVEAISKPWPAAARRHDRLQDWKPWRTTSWRRAVNAMDPVTTVARQAWLLVQQLSKGLEDALEQAMHLSLPVQACLCDVWHDHVLFTGAQVTGLIDYGSVKDDHISVDLARLLGSLAEDDETLWQAGLSAYAAIKPLSNEDIDRVRWLDRTGVLVGVVNWLVWLYRENRPFEHRQAVAERLGRLVKRIGKWLK